MAHVVVTGAAGFIGAHLAERLHRDGHAVTGIDRRPGVPWPATPRLADVAAADERARAALRAADAVFHLAGCPGVRTADADVDRRRRRDNVAATARVAALTPRDVPLVLASSSSVYGGARLLGERPRPSHEDDARRPRGGYARSKAAAEDVAAARAAAGGLVAVARLFTVAGLGQRPDMAIARWLAAARAGRPVEVYGSPDRVRDVTDVRAAVEGLVRLAERGVAETVNLGTGVPHRLGDVVDAVAAATGRTPTVRVRPAGEQEPPATLAATGRCERLLGFVPATDLAELVRWQAADAARAGPAA